MLRTQALAEGMRTLRHDGWRRVLAGQTTVEEVVRVTSADTEILDEQVPVEEILKMVPAARMGTPEEVAGAVNFLMSEEAAYITRQVLAVNGGLC